MRGRGDMHRQASDEEGERELSATTVAMTGGVFLRAWTGISPHSTVYTIYSSMNERMFPASG